MNFGTAATVSIGQLKAALGKEAGGTTNRWQEKFGYPNAQKKLPATALALELCLKQSVRVASLGSGFAFASKGSGRAGRIGLRG